REATACVGPQTSVPDRRHAAPAIAAARTTAAAKRPDPVARSPARCHSQRWRGAPDDPSHRIRVRRCAWRAKTARTTYRQSIAPTPSYPASDRCRDRTDAPRPVATIAQPAYHAPRPRATVRPRPDCPLRRHVPRPLAHPPTIADGLHRPAAG